MRIKCRCWELDASGDFCCADFKKHAFAEFGRPEIILSNGIHVVSFKNVEIKYCPFCGKEIILEKEVC
jgi:hypothetical protein